MEVQLQHQQTLHHRLILIRLFVWFNDLVIYHCNKTSLIQCHGRGGAGLA